MKYLKVYKETHLENSIQFAMDNPNASAQKVEEFTTQKAVKYNDTLYLSDPYDILG